MPRLQHVSAGCKAEHVLGFGAFLVAMSLVVGGWLSRMSPRRSLRRRAWRIVVVPALMGKSRNGKEQKRDTGNSGEQTHGIDPWLNVRRVVSACARGRRVLSPRPAAPRTRLEQVPLSRTGAFP